MYMLVNLSAVVLITSPLAGLIAGLCQGHKPRSCRIPLRHAAIDGLGIGVILLAPYWLYAVSYGALS